MDTMTIKTGPSWRTVRWGILWMNHYKRIHTPYFTVYITR
jgi:hypothetical protein